MSNIVCSDLAILAWDALTRLYIYVYIYILFRSIHDKNFKLSFANVGPKIKKWESKEFSLVPFSDFWRHPGSNIYLIFLNASKFLYEYIWVLLLSLNDKFWDFSTQNMKHFWQTPCRFFSKIIYLDTLYRSHNQR